MGGLLRMYEMSKKDTEEIIKIQQTAKNKVCKSCKDHKFHLTNTIIGGIFIFKFYLGIFFNRDCRQSSANHILIILTLLKFLKI